MHGSTCLGGEPLAQAISLEAAYSPPLPPVPAPRSPRPRFTPEELGPYLQPLLEKLFAAFALPESGENEYLMKAVMRCITFVGERIRRAGRRAGIIPMMPLPPSLCG